VLAGELVIINASVESDSLIGLDRKTGQEVWRTGGIREAWNTPLLTDVPGQQPELVIGVFGKVLGFDPKTGKELWSCEGINNYVCPSPVAKDGVVYVSAGRDRMTVAVKAGGRGDVTATHLLWKVRKGSNVSSPIVHNGHVYLGNDQGGIVYCLNAKTGETVYEERLGRVGEMYGSPVLAGDKLYYPSRHGGEMVVLPAEPRFRELAHNSFGERSRSNASPAVAGGRLFLRTDEYLYCIGEK
jgi:outer membrane protein assembly factor BamB